MPKRNETSLSVNEVFYVRKPSGKCYRVFSPQQLREMLDAGRIAEDDFVGIQKSPEGLGGNRGTEKESTTRPILSSQSPWSYCS